MVDYSPTWEQIANKWRDVLAQELGYTVYYPYPENAVDKLELPCVIINEPQGITSAGFSFGAVTMTYTGELSLLVLAVDTGQASLAAGDINEITAATLSLNLAVHNNRRQKGYFTHAALGEGKLARLSPHDPDERGNYAGMAIPYTIQMQYGS